MSTVLPPLAPSAQLSIHTSNVVPGGIRVAVAGEIDLSTADVLHAELLALFGAGTTWGLGRRWAATSLVRRNSWLT